MNTYKKVIAEEIDNVICDCCSNSCTDKATNLIESALFVAGWGYSSKRDGEKWECDLCEGCAVKIKEFIESIGGKVNIKEG